MANKLQVNENIVLYEKKNSLSFGTDSYLLYAYMKGSKKDQACELGSGTGIISMLCMQKEKFEHINMFEYQKELYDLSIKNLDENNLSKKISAYNCDIKDIPNSFNNRFGYVFANPPYIKTNQGFANKDLSDRMCCSEIIGNMDDFCKSASKLLKNGGSFICVYRPDRLSYLITCLKKYNLEPKRITFVYPTVDSKPCLVLCENKKDGNESVFITKPLIIYKSKRDKQSDENYTSDMNYIYKEGNFDDAYRIP